MLRLAFDFIIAWREIRARPNAYERCRYLYLPTAVVASSHGRGEILPQPWKDLVTAVKN
ncbi:hypothetical protein NXW19_11515 [Bacteroides ovatus]|nr:hypothetical protein NXW52_02810 [Bacteroides ovatus]UVP79228.1 hypothetical protein NXW19_11515 [Bacteroides ovatus]CAG9877053.1 hypothetical protein BOVA115_1094 [Bacteroides ovatus]